MIGENGMRKIDHNLLRLLLPGAILLLACSLGIRRTSPTPTLTPVRATAPPSATKVPVQDTAGPERIVGSIHYTNDILTIASIEPAVALTDMYGFITRDLEWELPVEGQTIGYLDLDEANLTGSYWLQLPVKPQATFADVDQDGQSDAGVQVFAIAWASNYAGGPFSEGDDRSKGWPTNYASVQTDAENKDEVIGGKLIIWAPDDSQQFPTGFGADGLLFTEDDPVGPIPVGYAVVDLDQQPFGISQEAEPEVELYERQDIAVKDYSDLSYTEAFDRLFETASTEWAFNGVPGKEVNWQTLYDEIAPRVAEAEQDNDALAFYQALHEFALSIPDGHTGLGGGELGNQDFIEKTGGGFGFAIRELDDGKVIVVYVLPGGPAAEAGMEVGAEVTQFNGQPIAEAITAVQPYAGPFSLEASRRYQQTRYLLRTPLGTEAAVTFINPGGRAQTVTLTSVDERESFAFTSIHKGEDPNALPVEFRILDSGIGYVKLNSNYDDIGLILRLFERALQTFQRNGLGNVMIDLRQNGGGFPLGLAGYLTEAEIPLGQLEYYSEETGQFEPEGIPRKVTPFENQYRFEKIGVLVGQACASACELEAYGFSQIPGTVVIGMFPSAGVEAEVARGQFLLPEGMSFQIPTGRFTNPDGSIFIEGEGVVPTVKVPITAENVLSAEDVELRAAEDALLGVGAGDLQTEGGLSLSSPAAAEAALNSGSVQLLEELAQEQYDSNELSQAGKTYRYTINLDREQRLLLVNGWCATTEQILSDNLQHVTFEYEVNSTPVDLEQFAVFDGPNGDHYCRFYYTVAYRWPRGQTTQIDVKVTFDEPINDGEADYPEGTHTYSYIVTLP
jgi:C-terminal processing protease CtpA/Prc